MRQIVAVGPRTDDRPLPPWVRVYKPQGATPLEAVMALRAREPEFAQAKLGYAGRLDPMAEGLLLLLVNDENRHSARYLALDKDYRVEVLFGFATDTDDALGIVSTHETPPRPMDPIRVAAESAWFVGQRSQRVPAYASVPLRGRPLYHWARQGTLDPADIPTRVKRITRCDVTAWRTIDADVLHASIATRIARVTGRFRQQAVLARWHDVLHRNGGTYTLATLDITCESGTYVRAVARDLGARLGTCALALSIVRTRIGPHTVGDGTG